jgi:hypothetical protein
MTARRARPLPQMHRALAGWLVERPWRAVLASVAVGVLSPQGLSPFAVVAAAIPVLALLKADGRIAILAAGAAAAAGAGVLLSAGQSAPLALGAVTIVFAAPLALGWLYLRVRSLNLCFQVAVLAMGILLVAIHVVLPDPGAVWEKVLAEATRSLDDAGLKIDADEVIGSLRDTMWGSYAALALVTMLGSLFLGRWWQALLDAPGTFGREFRQLRLGVVLGVTITLIVLASLVLDVPAIDALAWVGVTAMAFQGLAAAHRRRAGGRLGQGWLVLIYVFLIVPPTAFIMSAMLAGWGFIDNWQRSSLRPH